MRKLRLDRLLANLGYGSRRTVQNLVNAGLVTLDGEVLREAERHIVLADGLRQRLLVEGEPLDLLPGLVVLLHKPVGFICSRKEEEGKLVFDLFPERWQRREPCLSTVGRLDKETSGLLLLTDDGALLHRIISPKRKIEKEYEVVLARPLRGDEGERFASGELRLEGEPRPLLPAKLAVHSPTRASLVVYEGRYHQVRRMFAAVGNHVVSLHRSRIGGLELPGDLKPSEYRILEDTDTSKIFGDGKT